MYLQQSYYRHTFVVQTLITRRARCRYKSPGQGREIMIANDVRIVNSNQEKGKVFFHMVNGKTVVRTMCASEIIKANTIGNREGEDARIAEYVRLFNERYSEPQKITYVEPSERENRYFELYNMSNVVPLTPDEEEELEELKNEEYTLSE